MMAERTGAKGASGSSVPEIAVTLIVITTNLAYRPRVAC